MSSVQLEELDALAAAWERTAEWQRSLPWPPLPEACTNALQSAAIAAAPAKEQRCAYSRLGTPLGVVQPRSPS